MTRIALLHYSGPPVIGGVENTIAVHARLLIEAGFEVSVIVGRGEPFNPQVDVQVIPQIGSRHPDVLSTGKELAAGNVTTNFERLKDEILERLRPALDPCDLVIAHNTMTMHKNLALTAALYQLASEESSAYIAWCHDFAWLDELYIPELHPGFPWDLLRNPWPNVKYVVVSQHRGAMIANLLGLPRSEISVITPGVDIGEFLGLSPLVMNLIEKLDLLRAHPLMLLPARVTRRKNIEFAIRVTACLQPHFPRPTLLVTGPPGPHNPKNLAYLKTLNHMKTELGLQQRVFFLYEQGSSGHHLELPYSAVSELYRISDLLLFPSQREGFGIPALEAGLARLPVFAASIPAMHESMGDYATFFDPNGDPELVANLIQGFLNTSNAYQLRRQMIDHYSWQSIFRRQILPLIEDVKV
jgi:glycosyltransferase involved in cell wall biosynthesis